MRRAGPFWCGQCKREKSAVDFLKFTNPKVRVTKCNECAHENMEKWGKMIGRYAGQKISNMAREVKDAGE